MMLLSEPRQSVDDILRGCAYDGTQDFAETASSNRVAPTTPKLGYKIGGSRLPTALSDQHQCVRIGDSDLLTTAAH